MIADKTFVQRDVIGYWLSLCCGNTTYALNAKGIIYSVEFRATQIFLPSYYNATYLIA